MLKTDKMRTAKNARFYTTKRLGNTYFAITTDFLDNYLPTEAELEKCKVTGLTNFFELYDDDGHKYYSGFANWDLMAENGMDEFTILDIATGYAGCTYMMAENKDGRMEMV